jgi:hypothetical protein
MPQPESYSLRQKFIQAIKLDGLKIIEARGYSSTLVALAFARQALSDKIKQETF